jgi:hypothetical protein
MKEKSNALWLKTALTGLCAAAIALGLTAGGAVAHDERAAEKKLPPHEQPYPHEPPTGGHRNLSEAATNPIANLVQFQLQDAYNWDNHNSSGYSNSFVIQPVIPIKLPWEKVPLLITRSTLPFVSTPDLDAVGRKHGFGDFTFLGLATPRLKTKGMQLGFGGTFVVPTAGDNSFTGSGKWQAGPSFLYINMRTPKLQWGLFAFQLWSFASFNQEEDREDVSKLSLQPFITKHFGQGWYVGSPDVPQTYDFEADKWTWALGPQVGRVMKLGKIPAKLFGAVYYNPEDDAGPTAKWTAKFNITFLFPK